jgi:hypothetical protein
MSKVKMILSVAALIGCSGIVACSHADRRSNVDANAVTPPSVSSGMTTAAPVATAPTDLGASTSGRGL